MIKITCANCGKKLQAPEEAVGEQCRCPHCKNVFRIAGGSVFDLKASVRAAADVEITQMRYADFWLRVVAYFLDAIILWFLILVIGGFAGYLYVIATGIAEEGARIIAFVMGIFIAWLYYALLESSSWQATLGKMALGMKVTDMGGRRIGFGRATGRYFAKIISGIILGIGYLMVAYTDKNQGLHDRMAGCLVVMR